MAGTDDGSLRLDFLIRNGQGPYGFKFLVCGNQAAMDDHLERCTKYARLHLAHVYAVNIMLPTPTGRMPKRPKLPTATSKVSKILLVCKSCLCHVVLPFPRVL